MLEFHYQEKYVNVTFTDFDTTFKTGWVGPRPHRAQRRGHLITNFE